MADCFVIMPVSTPTELAAQYRNDDDHFRHVLDHLFQPAVENAGFKMIPPNFGGSELIPAEIVSRLEQSNLVLCDISTLNPNVFLELGIRTALNKPVALVKDGLTERVPFDTATIGHYTYDESLSPWTLESQITKLTEHIKQVERAGDQNAMWKYFGMRLHAGTPPGEAGVEERLDFIMQRLDQVVANQRRRRLPNQFLAEPVGGTTRVVEIRANGDIGLTLNVSSVSDLGAGRWGINWGEDYDSLDYSVETKSNTGVKIDVLGKSVGGIIIGVGDSGTVHGMG